MSDKQTVGHKIKMARHKLMAMVTKEEFTGDEEYDNWEEKFKKHVFASKRVLDELTNFANVMRKMGAASEVLGDVIGTYYRTPDVEKPAKAGDVVQNALNKIGLRVAQSMDNSIDQVHVDWLQYCTFLDTVLARINDRKLALEQFDYYRKKVQALKEKPPKDPHKLPNNENKLEVAQNTFFQINNELKHTFQALVNDSSNAMTPCVTKFAPALTELFHHTHNAAQDLKLLTEAPDNYGCIAVEPKFKMLVARFSAPIVPAAASPTSPKGNQSSGQSPFNPMNRGGDKQRISVASGGGNDDSDDDGFIPDHAKPQNVSQKVQETQKVESSAKSAAVVKNVQEPGLAGNGGRKRVKAMFDFESEQDDELSFREGDVLNVLEESEEGWWRAELNGKQGMIPFNYVEVL